MFEAGAEQLHVLLDIPRGHIQHVGSTSVPGMVAKPILDIAILVESLEIVGEWKDLLERIGYWHKGIEPDLPDRRFFAKGPRNNRTVYIHVVTQNEYDGLIKFRDSLRSNPKLTKEYSNLKEKLAKAHAEDRDTYTRSKKDFIQRVLNH